MKELQMKACLQTSGGLFFAVVCLLAGWCIAQMRLARNNSLKT